MTYRGPVSADLVPPGHRSPRSSAVLTAAAAGRPPRPKRPGRRAGRRFPRGVVGPLEENGDGESQGFNKQAPAILLSREGSEPPRARPAETRSCRYAPLAA